MSKKFVSLDELEEGVGGGGGGFYAKVELFAEYRVLATKAQLDSVGATWEDVRFPFKVSNELSRSSALEKARNFGNQFGKNPSISYGIKVYRDTVIGHNATGWKNETLSQSYLNWGSEYKTIFRPGLEMVGIISEEDGNPVLDVEKFDTPLYARVAWLKDEEASKRAAESGRSDIFVFKLLELFDSEEAMVEAAGEEAEGLNFPAPSTWDESKYGSWPAFLNNNLIPEMKKPTWNANFYTSVVDLEYLNEIQGALGITL